MQGGLKVAGAVSLRNVPCRLQRSPGGLQTDAPCGVPGSRRGRAPRHRLPSWVSRISSRRLSRRRELWDTRSGSQPPGGSTWPGSALPGPPSSATRKGKSVSPLSLSFLDCKRGCSLSTGGTARGNSPARLGLWGQLP